MVALSDRLSREACSSEWLFLLMIRRPPRSTQSRSSAASDVYKRQGRHRRDVPLILSALRGLGYDVEELETEAAGDASGLARGAVEAGFDIVAVLGGDGTVNEAVNGLAGSDVPLAIIPTGTVNVLAMELGIPLDPPDAVKLLGAAVEHVSWIDLGRAGERYFGLMAGVGMDAAVVAALHPAMKKALKEAAFAVQGLATYLTLSLIHISEPTRPY